MNVTIMQVLLSMGLALIFFTGTIPKLT